MTDEDARAYLQKANIEAQANNRKKNFDTLKKWLRETPERRPFFYLTKQQLIDVCVNKFGGAKKNFAGEGKDELIARLAACHNERPGSTAAPPPTCRPGSSNANATASEATL